MRGFILAAGMGQRMRPITDEVPKPLLPVGNLPLVGYAIRMLRHFGIVDIIVNTHHLAPQLEQTLGDGAALGVKITYSREAELLGTGGALKRMHELLDETFVVVNSDIVTDVDLAAVLRHHRGANALATMVLRGAPTADLARIEIDTTGRICRLLGQGRPLPASQGPLKPLMFTGVHVLEPRFLDYLPAGVETCVVKYGYAKALANQELLSGYSHDGFWMDAGTPADFLQINALAIGRGIALPWADPVKGYAHAPRRDTHAAIRLGEDVRLGQKTHVQPPLVVGDGSRLGDSAQLGPETVVGRGVHVGKEAQVAHSVVLDGARIEAGAMLVDCIVGRHQRLQVASPAKG